MENQLVSGICPCLCIPSTVQLKFNSNLIKHCFIHNRLLLPSSHLFVYLLILKGFGANLLHAWPISFCVKIGVIIFSLWVKKREADTTGLGERTRFGPLHSSFCKCNYGLIQSLRPGDLNVVFCTNTHKCIKICT